MIALARRFDVLSVMNLYRRDVLALRLVSAGLNWAVKSNTRFWKAAYPIPVPLDGVAYADQVIRQSKIRWFIRSLDQARRDTADATKQKASLRAKEKRRHDLIAQAQKEIASFQKQRRFAEISHENARKRTVCAERELRELGVKRQKMATVLEDTNFNEPRWQ